MPFRMGDVCIPIPGFKAGGRADVSVVFSDKQPAIEMRIEAFYLNADNEIGAKGHNSKLFDVLKEKIDAYNKDWEVLQVFAPERGTNVVKVLFRKR